VSYDEKKYRPGLRRWPAAQRAHLYEIGEHSMDFGNPMCLYGWTDPNREGYSIWRGNVGPKGICKICIRRAEEGLAGIECPVPYEEDSGPLLTPEEQAEVDKLLESVK
jgi:hypothetical protein